MFGNDYADSPKRIFMPWKANGKGLAQCEHEV